MKKLRIKSVLFIIFTICFLLFNISFAREGKFSGWKSGTGAGYLTADLPISVDAENNITIRTATDIVNGVISAADHAVLTDANTKAAAALPAATYNSHRTGNMDLNDVDANNFYQGNQKVATANDVNANRTVDRQDFNDKFLTNQYINRPPEMRVVLDCCDYGSATDFNEEYWDAATTEDYTHYVFRSGLSRKFTITATGNVNTICHPGYQQNGGFVYTGNSHWWFYLDHNDVNSIELRMYADDTNAVNYWQYYPYKQYSAGVVRKYKGAVAGQWWPLAIDACDWTGVSQMTGISPVGQPIKRIYISITAGAHDVNVYFGGLVLEDAPKAAIVLGFDGVYQEAYQNAIPDLLARGYKGTLYCNGLQTAVHNPGNKDHADKMDVNELRTLYNMKWDVIAHNWAFQYTASTSEAAVRKDLTRAQKWMISCGFLRACDFASPMASTGTYTGATDARALVAERYIASRSNWINYNMYDDDTIFTGQPWPDFQIYHWFKPDVYNIQCLALHDGGSDAANIALMQTRLNRLLATKGCIFLYTHEVYEGSDASVTALSGITGHTSADYSAVNDITTTAWDAIFALINAQVQAGNLELITVSEYLDRTIRRTGNFKYFKGYDTSKPGFYKNDPNVVDINMIPIW